MNEEHLKHNKVKNLDLSLMEVSPTMSLKNLEKLSTYSILCHVPIKVLFLLIIQ